jgi:hypothetical protein
VENLLLIFQHLLSILLLLAAQAVDMTLAVAVVLVAI